MIYVNMILLIKPFSEFTKIDCNKYSQNIIDNKIKMNIKDKQIEQDEKGLKNKELEEKIISLEKELKEEKSKNEIYLKTIKNLNDYLEKYKKNDLADKNLEKDKTEKKVLEVNPDELLKGEKLISVNFTTMDEKMHYSIICKSTDIFSKIEDQFYNDNPKYNKNENIFMIGNKKIENSKTLDDNDIHNNSIIILKKSEIKDN